MDLPRAGREYAHWGFGHLPTNPGIPDAYLLAAWTPLAWWDDDTDPNFAIIAERLDLSIADITAGTARIARILVAGPDATSNPIDTVVLSVGRHFTPARLSDNPEVIIRGGGTIDVR